MSEANAVKDESGVAQRSELQPVVMNRYVYHYCAQYQSSMGQISYIDGIAQLENRITCHADYQKLKPLIEPVHHDKLIITSFSFIGMDHGS